MDETPHSLWPTPTLLGEERPRDMLLLLGMLVILLHLWLVQWLTQSNDITNPAKPLVMAVSMITVAAPKQAVAPPQPVPPPPEKKPLPKKAPPKPIEKKPPPVVQKAPDFAPSEPTAEPQQASQPSTNSAPAVSESKAAATSEQFTEANFRANYAHNPKPEYPSIARSRGWTGKVLLKVRVSADGLSESVEVEQSSGHDILDENAIKAVKQWRFIPAKRGETAVASSVIVPIAYSLNNN